MPKSVDRSPFDGSAGENPTSNPTTTKRVGRPLENVLGWIPVFIDAITSGMSIKSAALIANIHVTTVYQRRREDEQFRIRWDEAAELGTKLLEHEATRRAYHGVDEPVYYKGDQCGVVRRYSDTLLMFLLKKRDPSYRDSTSVTVNNNNLQVNVFDDIERDIQLIASSRAATAADRPPDSGVPQDRLAEPVDAPQADGAAQAPEAD